ncbi:hypothetical protein D917_10810, partial [Trichinella nativa]
LSETHKAIYNKDHLLLFEEHIDSSSDYHHSSILSGTYVIDVDLNTLTARKMQSSTLLSIHDPDLSLAVQMVKRQLGENEFQNTVIFTTSLLGENLVVYSKFTEKVKDSYILTNLYTIRELPLLSSHVLFTGLKGENLSSIMEMKYGTYHWVPDKIIEVNPNNKSFVQIDIQ